MDDTGKRVIENILVTKEKGNYVAFVGETTLPMEVSKINTGYGGDVLAYIACEHINALSDDVYLTDPARGNLYLDELMESLAKKVTDRIKRDLPAPINSTLKDDPSPSPTPGPKS